MAVTINDKKSVSGLASKQGTAFGNPPKSSDCEISQMF